MSSPDKESSEHGICEDCGKKIEPRFVRCYSCHMKRIMKE